MAKFYITTPIFYPNANLHMGHAYTTTLSDALARFHRQNGDSTYFLTGSDENTQKMVDAARKAGKEPMQFLDEIVGNFAGLFRTLNISYDQFIRTTNEEKHHPGAMKLWERLMATGDLYKKEYEGLYCVGHEAFITEKDLVDGKCPDHGTEPQFLKEENYFFKLSKYTDEIKRRIESDELRIVPETRKNEILSLLNEGLEDVSFSRPRKADWPKGLGVPVPGDDTQVMYVWCDALSNYITALGYGTDETLFNTFWPADVHVIGKDILRFHAAIWPGMLLSAGISLPKSLLVHGFVTSGGKKMSKSLGNIIDPGELLAEYGTDAVRYYLLRHISPFEDGDLTREAFKDAYNGNLANGLGNLVSRVLTLSEKYLTVDEIMSNIGFLDITDGARIEGSSLSKVIAAMQNYRVDKAMDAIWEDVAGIDSIIQKEEPFKLIKTNPTKGKESILNLVQRVWRISVALAPFMPDTSLKIQEAVRANKKPENLFARKD